MAPRPADPNDGALAAAGGGPTGAGAGRGAPGPLALVGAGEYLEVMLPVERELIRGRPPRYVQIPTAAAREGPERLQYWIDLGRRQAERIGVEAVPLVVADREEADDRVTAEQVRGAGLIYLSGGSPGFLADTLRDTALWWAIVAAWESGAALAGCSAGAIALTDWVPDIRNPGGAIRRGLGLLPHLRVMPHFDRMIARFPERLRSPLLAPTPGVSVVGIDEDTALVGGPDEWVVAGRQSVWVIGEDRRDEFRSGRTLLLSAAKPAS